MQPSIPNIEPAFNQLSSTGELGPVVAILSFIIVVAVGWYVYISSRQLNLAEEERRESERRRERQRTDSDALMRELNGTLSRLADVQETSLDFIKQTVDHERKNHEQCKDKFYEKLVAIEQWIKQGAHSCELR